MVAVLNTSDMSGNQTLASRRMIVMVLATMLGITFAISLQGATTKKSSHSSGIKGTITLTGNCPGPQRKDNDTCGPRPYEGEFAVKRSSDQVVVSTGKSNHEGQFKIDVAPGKYIITQAGEARYPMIHSDEIIVEKHKFTTVKLTADLGMR